MLLLDVIIVNVHLNVTFGHPLLKYVRHPSGPKY